ncbi:hypothetical protein I6A84_13290 [Frankia sp. CNm7]|uniref:Uncharacterized protein n=1 Tax=Frankia nepalensis TaxID=1836974 RepID=A0A937RJS5_9ACTN|nr:hypothetical protein [Frankia nepalensis]MBL7496448.1 hypothetical protein [Frankia nepalensis]MBL7510815.1 hypothetical protein [Frankia nepalensis]MBL7519053.1 hypothetical protein [Frankia nepalensis]MBL7630235.1 hypothetical protein [Frankia nepalensis]
MAPAGLAWQTLPEPGTLALVDPESRRAAAFTRPHPADLSISELVAVEQHVARWLDPATRQDAEEALTGSLAGDPMPTLRSLCWLMASWAVGLHLRTGHSPTQVLAQLTLSGLWRGPQAPETERIWELLTAQVRAGALAALTNDTATARAFEAAARTRVTGYPECLLHHGLLLMASLWSTLAAYGLDLRDVAGTLALYTQDSDEPRAGSFRPLT